MFVCDAFPLTRARFVFHNLLKEQPPGHSESSAKNLGMKSQKRMSIQRAAANIVFLIEINAQISVSGKKLSHIIFAFGKKSSHKM